MAKRLPSYRVILVLLSRLGVCVQEDNPHFTNEGRSHLQPLRDKVKKKITRRILANARTSQRLLVSFRPLLHSVSFRVPGCLASAPGSANGLCGKRHERKRKSGYECRNVGAETANKSVSGWKATLGVPFQDKGGVEIFQINK